jgi:hypothetical protein
MIPTEHERAFPLGSQVRREPRQEQTGDRTDWTPAHNASEHLIERWQTKPITGNRVRLWSVGGDLLFDEGEGGLLTPAMHPRLCLPAPPDVILKAPREICLLLG